MTEFLTIMIGAALANNLVLIQLTGVSSLFSFSNRFQEAAALGLLSGIVMLISSQINYVINTFLLVPFELDFLRLVVFVLISATTANLLLNHVKTDVIWTLRRKQLPLIILTGNSAVLGVSLAVTKTTITFFESMAYSLGAAIGFASLLLVIAALRERLETSDVPLPFRGLSIVMLSTGIATMAILGFAGIV